MRISNQQVWQMKVKLIPTTLLLWTLACGAHFYFRTTSILNGPHEGELYAYTWSFQALSFCVFRLPLWVVGLVLIVGMEWAMVTRARRTSTKD